MSEHLLDARQMARFIADGYLRFDAIVPEALNQAVLGELQSERLRGCRYNDERIGFDDYFAESPAYLAVMRLPRVQGMIESLVGPEQLIDHCAVHTVRARCEGAQFWHADATIDARTTAFDIQVFYYPHDTPREAGGTLFLPGSHLRHLHEATIARYQNIRGQVPMVCPAGTIVVAHHGLWHCSQPNRTERTRYMVKLRLNPTVRQRGLFDASGVERDELGGLLSAHHGWEGVEHRLEILQRLRLWRSLTGSDFDHALWLSRLDNQPTREAPRPALALAAAG
jgi:ectoine hydroxylase-related dioxygenase (phytanoyl-CoA dioxygenase family)